MAQEQLAYSFRGESTFDPIGDWPFDNAPGPMLLLTGKNDEVMFADICTASEALADRAKGHAPVGCEVTIPDCGHSIHDERPEQLAAEIDRFLSQPEGNFT